jgi:hypothetical protein
MSDEIEDGEDGGEENLEALYAKWDKEYAAMSTVDMVRGMATLKGVKERLEDELKAINKEYDYVRLKAVPKRFEDEGIEILRVEGVGRVSLTGDMYVKPVKTKMREFFDWLRDHGSGGLIKETVAASTLKAAVKQWMQKGEEVPDEFLKVEPFTRASITKTRA